MTFCRCNLTKPKLEMVFKKQVIANTQNQNLYQIVPLDI